jgi:hypothetical protein
MNQYSIPKNYRLYNYWCDRVPATVAFQQVMWERRTTIWRAYYSVTTRKERAAIIRRAAIKEGLSTGRIHQLIKKASRENRKERPASHRKSPVEHFLSNTEVVNAERCKRLKRAWRRKQAALPDNMKRYLHHGQQCQGERQPKERITQPQPQHTADEAPLQAERPSSAVTS